MTSKQSKLKTHNGHECSPNQYNCKCRRVSFLSIKILKWKKLQQILDRSLTIFVTNGRRPQKRRKFYEIILQTGGGGVNWISYLLFRTIYVLRNTIKILNKNFIKSLQGGWMKLFHKIQFFSGDGFPSPSVWTDWILFLRYFLLQSCPGQTLKNHCFWTPEIKIHFFVQFFLKIKDGPNEVEGTISQSQWFCIGSFLPDVTFRHTLIWLKQVLRPGLASQFVGNPSDSQQTIQHIYSSTAITKLWALW